MRTAIIGNSGSGKSTLARTLGVPALDLDTVAWLPESPPRRRLLEESRVEIDRHCAGPGWVVEGCYADLIELALAHGPELVFLNPGVEACIANCRRRSWEPHKYATPEAQDANLEMLVAWVRGYAERDDACSYRAHRELFDRYDGPKREVRGSPTSSC